jgi:hypothetical protein
LTERLEWIVLRKEWGLPFPPSYTLDEGGSEMFSVKPHVTDAGHSIIKDPEMTAQPASTGPNPYPAPDSSLEIQEGVNKAASTTLGWREEIKRSKSIFSIEEVK